MLCEYGCGQEAKYQFKNGKWCCSISLNSCPQNKLKKSLKQKGKTINKVKRKIENESILCDYGCNQLAKFYLLNGKACCSKTYQSCNAVKERNKKSNIGKNTNRNNPAWKGGYSLKKIPLYTKYMPQLSYVEECRQYPADKNILQVKCAYCGNWFIPTTTQVYERIRTLNGRNYGEQRFYCSEKCKHECPIFSKILYPKGFKPATSREVQPELRQMRFKIDNYTCQRCGKHQDELEMGLHCHHIEGIRWEPLESADLDKVITLCKNCHKEVHKIEGCGYNDMRCNHKHV